MKKIILLSSLIVSSAIVAGGVFVNQKEIQINAEVPITQEQISTTTETIIYEETTTNEVIAPVIKEIIPEEISITSEKIKEIEDKISQVKAMQAEMDKEQERQSNCIELENLKQQIQKLCHSYTFVELDKCIEIRTKDIENLKNYVPNDEQIKNSQGLDYYASLIQEEQDKVDQMISLKSKYELLKSNCN
jgi:archaellum component FlaC